MAGLGVVENGGYLLEVSRSHQERDVPHRVPREPRQHLGVDLENLVTVEGGHRNAGAVELAIGSVVVREGEWVLPEVLSHTVLLPIYVRRAGRARR